MKTLPPADTAALEQAQAEDFENGLKEVLGGIPPLKSAPEFVPYDAQWQDVDPTTFAPTFVGVDGYEDLHHILMLAYDQSAKGKGKDRHAKNPMSKDTLPFDKQPIMNIGRMVGLGYPAGQAQKKLQEAITLQGNGNLAGAKAEALGAIVYAAALYKLLEES